MTWPITCQDKNKFRVDRIEKYLIQKEGCVHSENEL